MQLPPFMSIDRIASLCDWPTADRRRLARQLRLTGSDGTEIDHHDETAFWNAIMPYFSNASAYQTLSSHLKQLSNKAYRRRLDQKVFDHLYTKAQFTRSLFSDTDDDDFLSRIVTRAVDCQAFSELADWLWAAWLAGFPAQSIGAIIDDHDPLRSLFGNWSPPIDAANDKPPAEKSDYLTTGDNDDVRTEESDRVRTEKIDHVTTKSIIVDHVGALFRKVRGSIDEAERMQAHEPLATALLAIEELAGHLRSRADEAQCLQFALAEFHAVCDRLRAREQPTDRRAAERLRKALSQFTDPSPRTPYVEVKYLADKITQLVDEADAARSAWRTCDMAHRDSPFDHEVRRACIDALELYEKTEGNLAGFLEEAVSKTKEGTDAVRSGDAEEQVSSEVEKIADNIPGSSTPVEAVVQVPTPNNGSGDEPGLVSQNEEDEPVLAVSTEEKNASEVNDAEASSRIDDPEETEPIAGSEDAEQLAATFLDRGDIGLFEIACSAGAGLNYHLPHPMLAQLLGLSGSQDAETQLRLTEALQALPATAANGPIRQGETWLRLAALSLPAVTDPTLLCRTALAQLKLDHPMVFEPKSLQATIVSLGRTYAALEAFAQTSAPEAEQELRDAKEDLRRYVGSLKGSTLAYQAATVVAHKLAQAFEKIATAQPLDPNAVEGMIDAVMRRDETDAAIIKRYDREARGAMPSASPSKLARLPASEKSLRRFGRGLRD